MRKETEMAATLTHQTQRALALYTFIDCDHPLQQAWSDYQFAKFAADGVPEAKARLKRELRLEAHITHVLESIHIWAHIHGYLPPRDDKRGAA